MIKLPRCCIVRVFNYHGRPRKLTQIWKQLWQKQFSVVIVFVFYDSIVTTMDATWNSQKIFCVLHVSINLMLQTEKKKKWVSPTKRVLTTRMNYDTKFYYSQNCPHNKKFDRSLTKSNFLYNSMVWKILFQTNLLVTVTV